MELIKDILKTMIEVPFPFYLLIFFGLVTYTKFTFAPKLVVAGSCLLIIFSFPIVPKFLAIPLYPSDSSAIHSSQIDLIVVPTAGVRLDLVQTWQENTEPGKWRASFPSIDRVNAGLTARQKFNKPLLIIGGTPLEGEATEADAIVTDMTLEKEGLLIEKTAKNSAETADKIASMQIDGQPVKSVLVVTSRIHTLRMTLSLKKVGLEVYALPATTSGQWYEFTKKSNFIPSLTGLALSNMMVKEYVGIVWYMLRGKINPNDLLQEFAS